jgi:hypothetical protein
MLPLAYRQGGAGASQEALARRRLKAMARKDKTAADPRGAHREYQRRIALYRNLREGVTLNLTTMNVVKVRVRNYPNVEG